MFLPWENLLIELMRDYLGQRAGGGGNVTGNAYLFQIFLEGSVKKRLMWLKLNVITCQGKYRMLRGWLTCLHSASMLALNFSHINFLSSEVLLCIRAGKLKRSVLQSECETGAESCSCSQSSSGHFLNLRGGQLQGFSLDPCLAKINWGQIMTPSIREIQSNTAFVSVSWACTEFLDVKSRIWSESFISLCTYKPSFLCTWFLCYRTDPLPSSYFSAASPSLVTNTHLWFTKQNSHHQLLEVPILAAWYGAEHD